MSNEELYAKAKDRYLHFANNQDLIEAKAQFESLGDYERAADYAAKCDTLLQYSVGSEVTMGVCEGKPIEWQIMEARGKMRLLVAKKIVTHYCYHETLTDASWATCTLRKWLNSGVIEFTKKEAAMIIPFRNENPCSEKWRSEGGATTMDRLFILDWPAIRRFWPDPEQRRLGEWWWVRTPGSNLCSAVAIYKDGTDYDFGINVHYKDGGVRPAMWVLLRV